MVAILNVTKGKNKVIVSGLAGALSALIFLTAIHIAAKIAIIVSAAAVTYLLLSLIHKIRTKAEITRVSGDKVSEDEGEEKDTVKEPKRTETELEEELKNKRAEEEMKNGLPKHMDFKGNSLSKSADTKDSHSVSSATNIVMEPLPKHMDALGNLLPERPSANISIESKPERKLSPAEWLLQCGNVNNDVREVLKQPIIQQPLNGLGF
ncbi:hypothetical protein [Wolbachia endosymbiont of Muscidifurax uniraptor]|uniref:hypothetical protein n=1 Tax=Wolbachia endosymbiont of Muscidifurax uniraptor TaxID=77037 RepID=UPI0001988BDD|nr:MULTISPECIES: hypothetical protein [Wolbachia]EEH12016.1 hypothetical protein WUni_006570 [Wolbachia endosymbiont of Muscidifurax uniraptor]ONI56891.1 hypothetical protein N500_0006 [Wolbachia pipientis wUni]